MAWASRKVSTGLLLRNWVIVYLGNFVGAIVTAYGMFLSGQYLFGKGAVGLNALNIANAKVAHDFIPALVLGIFCNALVCLAVWLCMGARTTVDKIVAIIFPISAFVAAGFEHSIANMYFVPVALFIKNGAPPEFWTNIGQTPADFAAVTWGNFFVANLLPVTLGNIIGGALMVGLVYWFIYLRPSWTGHKDKAEDKEPKLKKACSLPLHRLLARYKALSEVPCAWVAHLSGLADNTKRATNRGAFGVFSRLCPCPAIRW